MSFEAAMRLAKRGWKVFPVGPDKSPWTRRGWKDASNDLRVFARFDWKGADVGVACGSGSGVDVLDVDTHGGNGFLTIETLGLVLPATLMATTPRKGRHLWFRHVGGSRKLGPGLEWVGNGKYVVAEGRGRVWLNSFEPQEAPEELVKLVKTASASRGALLSKPRVAGPRGEWTRRLAHVDRDQPLPREVYSALCRVMRGARPRQARRAAAIWLGVAMQGVDRNHALNVGAWYFGDLVLEGAITADGATELLVMAAKANGLWGDPEDGERACLKTISGALGRSAGAEDYSAPLMAEDTHSVTSGPEVFVHLEPPTLFGEWPTCTH